MLVITELADSLPDIKLDNILLTLPDNEVEILRALSDVEARMPSQSEQLDNDRIIYASRQVPHGDTVTFPILCDLGSAVHGQSSYHGIAQALPYRAPEVILGLSWDHRVDIWNLGVLVCRCESLAKASA